MEEEGGLQEAAAGMPAGMSAPPSLATDPALLERMDRIRREFRAGRKKKEATSLEEGRRQASEASIAMSSAMKAASKLNGDMGATVEAFLSILKGDHPDCEEEEEDDGDEGRAARRFQRALSAFEKCAHDAAVLEAEFSRARLKADLALGAALRGWEASAPSAGGAP